MSRWNIGDRVICSESGVKGNIIKFYTPTASEPQIMVQTDDGRQYHAPHSMWSKITRQAPTQFRGETTNGSCFLCSKSESIKLMKQAEQEKQHIISEFRQYYKGEIDIRIYTNTHVMGTSIAGDLLVNGEACRTYDPVDLLFLDLNELMLKRLARRNAT